MTIEKSYAAPKRSKPIIYYLRALFLITLRLYDTKYPFDLF